MGEKQLPQSRDLLAKSITLDPLNAEALSLLAMCQLQTGNETGAIDAAQRTHQLPHEKWPIVHYVAGLAHEQRQQFEDAVREYKLFLKESPSTSPTIPRVKEAISAIEARKP
jgi:tetratricopeptide (TPR) repeat protein